MKGKWLDIMKIIVVATWIIWMMVSVEAEESEISTVNMNEKAVLEDYPVEPFSVSKATKKTYQQLIENLRNRLKNTYVYGIPVMRDTKKVATNQRYILVEISREVEEQTTTKVQTISLAMDVGNNAYIIAYAGRDKAYFLDEPGRDEVAMKNLFKTKQHVKLSYSGSYSSLEGEAKVDRLNVPLGGGELSTCVQTLYESKVSAAKCLIVCIEMISEAVRFPGIMQIVRRSFKEDGSQVSFKPSSKLLKFETSWDKFAKAVQETSNDGVFKTPVEVADVYVNSVRDLFPHLAIMLFKCDPISTSTSSHNTHLLTSFTATHHHPLLSFPSPQLQLGGHMVRMLSTSAENANKCPPKSDVSFLIKGLSDECITYQQQDKVTMSTCKAKDNNQIWTLTKDGTITSKVNGKCLTPTGNLVVVSDCGKKPADIKKKQWKISSDGTVSLVSNTNLVLTVGKDKSNNVQLQVQANTYRRSQSWLFTNRLENHKTPIIQYQDMCLDIGKKKEVKIGRCSDNDAQKWVIHADGSIVPVKDTSLCLTAADNRANAGVDTKQCDANLDTQRWAFGVGTTIFNPKTKLVIDAKNANSLVLSTQKAGEFSQLWAMTEGFYNPQSSATNIFISTN